MSCFAAYEIYTGNLLIRTCSGLAGSRGRQEAPPSAVYAVPHVFVFCCWPKLKGVGVLAGVYRRCIREFDHVGLLALRNDASNKRYGEIVTKACLRLSFTSRI